MGLVAETLSRINQWAQRLDPLTEAGGAKGTGIDTAVLKPPTAAQVRRTGYEYGIQLGGATGTQDAYSQERLQILTQLYQAYLTCPWVSSPIDLISRTATAGGLDIVINDIGDMGGVIPEDPPEVLRLRRLMKFTNPREDMVQLLRSTATDLLLFGDAYIEVVELLGEPVALYTLDATTMTIMADEHGEVTGYKQTVSDGVRTAFFDADQVIHISLDAPRGGIYGVSPAQKALLPVTAWLFTEATIKECFRRGDPPRLHVDLGSMKDVDVQRWREQYTVANLGPKAVGNPVITTGGGVVTPIDPRKVVDYLDTARQLRDEIISCFGTPPSKLGIIEAGNIGGAGTAEGQEKTFRVNTVYPLQALILEKLNFHLIQQGFGITGWHLEFGEIDMRDSKVVEDIRDVRLRNGSYTLNRYRDEIGEPPVDGGDEPVLIDRQNIVLWSNIEQLSQAGIAYKVKGTALQPDEPQPGEPLMLQKPDVPGQPQPAQPGYSGMSITNGPDLGPPSSPSSTGGKGPDKRLPAADRPGGPKDATQGKAPRESQYERDRRLLNESWRHAYRARRRQALRELPTVEHDSSPDHHHHKLPDYNPTALGIDSITLKKVDPKAVNTDHRYQRPLDVERVTELAKDPKELKGHVGLLAIRPDGSMWVVEGQHHTAAAVQDDIPELSYQTFKSSGWKMEQKVYMAYHLWHDMRHQMEQREADKEPAKV